MRLIVRDSMACRQKGPELQLAEEATHAPEIPFEEMLTNGRGCQSRAGQQETRP